MTFTLLPAIDVADGRVAGHPEIAPRDIALAWQEVGAEWIHLVDLDAAFGRGSNADLLDSLIDELDIDVELSGGIHDDASLATALSTEATRIVVGTGALTDPAWCARTIAAHGDRIAMSLDVRIIDDGAGIIEHRLAPRGGTGPGGDLWATIPEIDRWGCARYIVTDVTSDGMMTGPNLDLYRAVTEATDAPIVASGGVASIDDLRLLASAALAGVNLEGSIVGTALHSGRFTFAEAQEAVR